MIFDIGIAWCRSCDKGISVRCNSASDPHIPQQNNLNWYFLSAYIRLLLSRHKSTEMANILNPWKPDSLGQSILIYQLTSDFNLSIHRWPLARPLSHIQDYYRFIRRFSIWPIIVPYKMTAGSTFQAIYCQLFPPNFVSAIFTNLVSSNFSRGFIASLKCV